jgi:hypothetical protein
MGHLIDKELYSFDIGDLVRLNEDIKLEVGFGLITDMRFSFDDVYDLQYIEDRIKNIGDFIQKRNDDIFLSKPQILVLWTGRKHIKDPSSLWMYASEITLVQKVVKKL